MRAWPSHACEISLCARRMRIAWTAEYSLGLPDIDEQHRTWFSLTDRLMQAIHAGATTQSLEGVLDDLLAFSREHFAYEEKLMASIGYPDCEDHQRLHEEFLGHIAQLRERLSEGRIKIGLELLDTIVGWLRTHILIEDRKYSRHIHAQAG